MQLTFVFALMMLQAVGAIRIDPNPQPPKKEQFVAPFVTMPQPPAVPRVDFNACPFEGCQEDCNGHYLELGKSEWWVRVRLKDGRTGWVQVTDNFDGTDALA